MTFNNDIKQFDSSENLEIFLFEIAKNTAFHGYFGAFCSIFEKEILRYFGLTLNGANTHTHLFKIEAAP